jgi:aldehyde dehydrogenase (NAD+)
MGEIKSSWRNLIGGKWVDGGGGERIPVENPATRETVAEIARATADDVDRAVRAAAACHRSGALTDMRPGDRGRMIVDCARLLRARKDEIAEVLTLEQGKSLAESLIEIEGTARYFEYYGGMADKIEGRYIPLGKGYADYTVPVPYGVSAQIIPWNFPLEMIGRGLAPALAAGNAVVVKTPELTPLSSTFIAEICQEVGLPDGAVNMLAGYGGEAGAALASHPDVNQIVFTGSVATGKKIAHAAAENIVPAVLELGGKSAGIVYADADMDAVVESTRWGIFFNSGQVCSAMSRLVVHESVHDEVVSRIVDMAEGLSIGPGIDNNEITPVVSGPQLDKIENHALGAVQEGAAAATGGRRVPDAPGHFMTPTILTGVTADMTVNREEIFGPVLAVLRFKDEAEALDIANGTEFGLAAGVFTRDLDRAVRVAEKLDAGSVFVNEWYAGGVETPFGGTKKSGIGREKGLDGLANYTQAKNVGIRKILTAEA